MNRSKLQLVECDRIVRSGVARLSGMEWKSLYYAAVVDGRDGIKYRKMTAYLRKNNTHSVSNRNEPFKASTCIIRSYRSIRRSPVVWDGVEVLGFRCGN